MAICAVCQDYFYRQYLEEGDEDICEECEAGGWNFTGDGELYNDEEYRTTAMQMWPKED